MSYSATSMRTELNLSRRWLFTAGALAIFVIGRHVPLIGVNTDPLTARHAPGHIYDLLSERSRMTSIFALGFTPIFFGRLIFEFFKSCIPPLGRWAATDTHNQAELDFYALCLALILAAIQGFAVAAALMRLPALVENPGWPFLIVTSVTLTGSTALLAWLSYQITNRGAGDGFLLLLASDGLLNIPAYVVSIVLALQKGAAGPGDVLLLAAVLISALAILIFTSGARAKSIKNLSVSEMLNSIDIWPACLATFIATIVFNYSRNTISYMSPADSHLYQLFYFILLTSLLLLGFAWLRQSADPDVGPPPKDPAQMAMQPGLIAVYGQCAVMVLFAIWSVFSTLPVGMTMFSLLITLAAVASCLPQRTLLDRARVE